MDLKVIIRGLWDRGGGWLLIGLGGLALLLGWFGVADTALTSEQIPYVVSGGLFGIALIGVGATLLISGDLRDEWRKLDDIERAIREAGAVVRPAPLDDDEAEADADADHVANGTSKRRRRAVSSP